MSWCMSGNRTSVLEGVCWSSRTPSPESSVSVHNWRCCIPFRPFRPERRHRNSCALVRKAPSCFVPLPPLSLLTSIAACCLFVPDFSLFSRCPAFAMGGSPITLPDGGGPFLPVALVREIVVWSGDSVNGIQVVYDVQGDAVRGPKRMGDHGFYRQSKLLLDVEGGEVRR